MYKTQPCKEIDDLLDSEDGLSQASWQVRRHLNECASCRALVEALDSENAFELRDDAVGELEASILPELTPVRPLPPSFVFVLLFLALFVGLSALGVYRLGAFGWEVLSGFQKLVVFASLGASAALLSFSTVRQMVPGSKHFFPPALLPVAVFVCLSLAVAAVFQYEKDPQFISTGAVCLKAGIPFAIPAAVLFWFLLSRGTALHPYVAGITSGMLAGLIGTSVLEVHCPILDVRHILVWHLGVTVAGAFAGLATAFLGTAYRRWRDSIDHSVRKAE